MKLFRSHFQHYLLLAILISSVKDGYSQTVTDTIPKLQEVVVRAYFSEQSILRLPSSATVISYQLLNDQPGFTLVPALNTVPGVRMEERSPGSYRLSIRGSLLRSPFGIRNVKVYIDEFPLTDAGGNAYLNSIDPGSIQSLEVLKGPDGSLFGANSGGVVLINPVAKTSNNPLFSGGISGGSYGLLHEKIGVQKQWKDARLNINQAYQRSDGYRDNSFLQRHYGQLVQQWNYSPENQVRVLAFYSDLNYNTPGGLTLNQYNEVPQSARPSTPQSPGAVEQHAGVKNKTLFGGIVHEAKVLPNIRNVVAVFGTSTRFENPFITNYEVRDEGTFGLRSYFELSKNNNPSFNYKINLGAEWQQTGADIANYDNNKGERAALQAADNLNTRQYFYFTRFAANLFDRLTFEAAASLNYFRYKFNAQADTRFAETKFDPQLMPRFALSYQVSENMALRTSVSRGYSPPASAEVRASDNRINTTLGPENGWNYEVGIRLRNSNDRFWLDASIFDYRLQNAIVRRVNDDDTEFFINAGGTKQVGFEMQWSGWLITPKKYGLINSLQLRNSLTLSNFTFSNYQVENTDYSGNDLTGVPKHVVITSIDIGLAKGFYAFAQHNYTTRIPLNDANTAYAPAYNLVQVKAGWRKKNIVKPALEVFAGADNLLNEKYSLGNDLNAFGGRYYNAAAGRNFYGGVLVRF